MPGGPGAQVDQIEEREFTPNTHSLVGRMAAAFWLGRVSWRGDSLWITPMQREVPIGSATRTIDFILSTRTECTQVRLRAQERARQKANDWADANAARIKKNVTDVKRTELMTALGVVPISRRKRSARRAFHQTGRK